jgi:Zn-finger domain-containing protein
MLVVKVRQDCLSFTGEKLADVTPLVNRAIQLLDDISSRPKIDLKRIRTDLDYFGLRYLELEENLEEMKKLKDEMEQRGFDSPYFAIGMGRYGASMSKSSYRREDVDDQRDVARHKMFFRANASLKKGTFERTKCAIATHNIVIGHIEEFASILCECGRVLRGKEVAKIIKEKGKFACSKCKSKKGELKENNQGVFRMELLPHLPYGGEFILEISKFSPSERLAYRELIETLREKKKGRMKSATVTFKIPRKGKWKTKKEQVIVKKGLKLDYESILREKYGRIVIEHIRYHHERSILVSGRYNRQALAIAYTKILKENREKILDFLLECAVDVKKLKKYETLRESMESKMYGGVVAPSVSIDMRITEEQRELMAEFEDELKEAKLMDERGDLLPELETAIEYRQKIRKEMLVKIPKALFAWDIFKFLLIKPYRERRYASIFPGLQPIPESEQLESSLLILNEENIIKAIERFIDGAVISIENPHIIVFKKFEIEHILQDYLKVTSSRAVGGIALYICSDLELKTCAEVTSSDIEELKEVLKVIIRLGRRDVIPSEKLENLEDIKNIKISEKAKEFLALVR